MTDQEWDNQVALLGGGILQSAFWAKFQQAVGRQGLRGQSKNWAWQAFERRSRGLKYLMVPYGPVVKQNPDAALDGLLQAGRARRADFVRIEPVGHIKPDTVKALGGRRIHDLEPSTTLVLDLTRDEAELRSGLSSGHRNEINGTLRRGIVIEPTDKKADIDEFLAMMDDTAKRAGVTFFKHDYYRTMLKILLPVGAAKLYLARAEGQPVSAAIFYDFNGTRYYAHAGAYQDLNRKARASVSLVWQAILDAKAADIEKFDFWGIAPTDDPTHPWAGITKFKKAFGGEVVTTIGSWDIPIKKTKYRAYSAYRKLRRMD